MTFAVRCYKINSYEIIRVLFVEFRKKIKNLSFN